MFQKYKKLKLFLFKRPHWKPDHLNQNPELFGLLVHPDFSGPVKITMILVKILQTENTLFSRIGMGLITFGAFGG